MPHTSVLLPVRNGQATIKRAVLSTLAALPRDSELVVLDDASTDSTLTVLAGLPDQRLRIIEGHRSVGVSAALNRMLHETDSTVVARMDADDVCFRWRFRYASAAVGEGSRQAQAVFSTVVDWHSPGARLSPHAPIGISPRAFGVHLAVTNPVSHPTLLMAREALTSVGGYRDVPAEDYDLWMRLCLAGFSLRRLPLPTLGYRVHTGQVTASKGWHRASWAHPEVAQSYQELTAQVLGVGFPRLNSVASDPMTTIEQLDSLLRDFRCAVEQVSADLRHERVFLARVLTRKVAQVRALWRRSHISAVEPPSRAH